MAESELLSNVRRFPLALGAVLISPGRALREIEARERGGFSLLLTWCLLAAVALRLTDLADAVVGFEAGGGLRVVSVLAAELTQAVPVALAAALVLVIAAGEKRNPGVDLELGCAAALPFVFTRAVFRGAVVVLGRDPSPTSPWVRASYVLAGAWGVLVLVLAVVLVRRRPAGRDPEPAAPERARMRLAGWGALAVLAVALLGGVRWTVRNLGALGPVARGGPAPDFTLPRIDGTPGNVTLSAYRGRVVVLDFWATWCPPCLEALPMMHALSQELESQGVTFIGVDSDGPQTSPADVRAFVAEHGAPYPVAYDEGLVNERYRIRVLPTVVVVGKDGAIERVFMGSTGRGPLVRAVEAARAR